jgi:hypothetical protein
LRSLQTIDAQQPLEVAKSSSFSARTDVLFDPGELHAAVEWRSINEAFVVLSRKFEKAAGNTVLALQRQFEPHPGFSATNRLCTGFGLGGVRILARSLESVAVVLGQSASPRSPGFGDLVDFVEYGRVSIKCATKRDEAHVT